MVDVAEFFRKAIITGVGLGLMAKDEMESFAREMEKKFEMSEKDGKKFLDDLQERYEKAQKKLEDRVEKTVREFLKDADIVTHEDLKALKKEIRELKKAVSEGAPADDD